MGLRKDKHPKYLYKILSIENWIASEGKMTIVLPAFDEFIHFSTDEQLDRIILKYWSTTSNYVILKVHVENLKGRLVLEKNPGGSTKYYHLYEGSIPRTSIIECKVVEDR